MIIIRHEPVMMW